MLKRRGKPNLTISLPSMSNDDTLTIGVGDRGYNTPRNNYGVKKIRLYKGIFSLVAITCIVSFFYLIFYIFIVSPEIISALKGIVSESQQTPNGYFMNITNILKAREQALINQINIGSYCIIGCEICIMLCILGYLYEKMSYTSAVNLRHLETWSEGVNNEIRYANLKDIVNSTLITIFMIICFQIFFYKFGTNYKYIGSYGDDEIINIFLQTYIRS